MKTLLTTLALTVALTSTAQAEYLSAGLYKGSIRVGTIFDQNVYANCNTALNMVTQSITKAGYKHKRPRTTTGYGWTKRVYTLKGAARGHTVIATCYDN